MKKYRVTDKHNLIKKDTILKEIDTNSYVSDNWAHIFSPQEIAHWKDSNWIEEVQKPEFTKNDLVDFLEYLLKQYDRHNEICAIDFVNEWINKK